MVSEERGERGNEESGTRGARGMRSENGGAERAGKSRRIAERGEHGVMRVRESGMRSVE